MKTGGFKKLKKSGSFLLIAAAVQLMVGCGFMANNREEIAKTALQEKYQEEFEITDVFPYKLGQDYYRFQAYPVDDPNLLFRGSVQLEDHSLSDSYVERKVCKKIAEQVDKNLDMLPGYYYLFTHAMGPQPIANDKTISIKEYAELDPRNLFRVELFFQPQDASEEEVFNALKDAFKDLPDLRGEVRFYVVNHELMTEIQEYFLSNDDIYYEFSHKMNLVPYLELKYEKGLLNMSWSEFAAAAEGML